MFQQYHPTLTNHQRPLWIAGPCSAESEEALMLLAMQLKHLGVHVLRAGAWKPRTRPGAFEGYGAMALPWIKHAGIHAGLPVITEVASTMHVEEALNAGMDMLWVGARTSVNPFMVQEIADALKGVDIPVFIKNPVNPDVSLWQGAIERFRKNNIHQVAAIHRGFSSFENHIYRNKPNWELAIELKRRMPEVPLICDPSHICGNTQLVADVAQIAMNLQYDGLMIEVHHQPQAALSDAAQQLSVAQFETLKQSIRVRQAVPDNPVELSKLHDLRDLIDEIDDDIIERIARRMDVARSIGKYKNDNNIAILQPERFKEILLTRTEIGLRNELSENFIHRLYSLIHEESIFQQDKQMTKPELKGMSHDLKRNSHE
jgi:chorismate mutase